MLVYQGNKLQFGFDLHFDFQELDGLKIGFCSD